MWGPCPETFQQFPLLKLATNFWEAFKGHFRLLKISHVCTREILSWLLTSSALFRAEIRLGRHLYIAAGYRIKVRGGPEEGTA